MGIFFLLLIVYPFIELYALIKIGSAFGVFTALLGLFALSVIGASVLRRSGTKAWRKLGDEIAKGNDPSARLVDGVVVLVAGILLVMPGYVTGAIGLLLLLPPFRVVLRGVVRRRAEVFHAHGGNNFGGRGTYVDGEIIDVAGEIVPPEDER